MGTLLAHLARVLTYAALACGAAFACVLLLASPADADDSGSGLSLLRGATSDDSGPTEQVGRLVGDLGRTATDRTTGLVDDVVDEVVEVAPAVEPVVRPVTQTTTQVVKQTTDTVTAEVEDVTSGVDGTVGGVLTPGPTAPPGGAPPPPATDEPGPDGPAAEQPPAEAPTPGTRPADEPKAPAAGEAAAAGDRSRSAGGHADASGDPAPTSAPTSSLEGVAAPAPSVPDTASQLAPALAGPGAAADGASEAGAVQDSGPLGDPASCDDCATGSTGSTAELPTIHGLVGVSPDLSPGLTGAAVGRARFGPALTFSSPEESPD